MRVHKHRARKTIYQRGKCTKCGNKQGYSIDRSQPADKTDIVIAQAGEEYYTWHPNGCDWQFSREMPVFTKPVSEWQEKYSDFESRAGEAEDMDSNEREELRGEIEEYRDELQGRLDSIPYQLQDSHVLTERISELDSLIEQLD